MAVEWIKQADLRTGREVWQITQAEAVSHFCYQTVQGFTADERHLVFSSNRTGSWHLFRADLTDGEVERITNLPDLHTGSFSMHPNGRDVCFSAGWTIYRADVAAGKVTPLINLNGRVPMRPRGHPMAISADGERIAVSCQDGADRHALCVVFLAEQRVRTVLATPKGPLLHEQICPGDPDLITFDWFPDTQNDMSLPMAERARAWTVNVRTREVRPFLTCPRGSRGTHEHWSADGGRLFFHHKTEPGWVPTHLCSIDRDGGDWQTHYTHETWKLGHSDVTRDGRWIVTDVQEPGENALLLVDAAAGTAEVLCWPNSSVTGGHPKHAHVHPSFSPRGRFVGFTSDRTGRPQVYVVPL